MRRPTLLLLFTILVVPALSIIGCAADSSTIVAHERVDTASLLAIDVENFRGSVEVRVDPALDDIEVSGRAYGAWFEDDPEGAELELPGTVELFSELQQDGRGVSTLRVRTFSERDAADHKVAVLIRVPRCDGARVRNRGGLVELVGTHGALDIENYEGHVEVRTNRPMTQDATIMVVDGTVYFQVPPGSTGKYDLETLDGRVRFKNRVVDATDTYSTRTQVQTVLENAQNRVTMRTNYGDLRVLVVDNPESYTRVRRARQVDILDGLFLQGSRRYTRNLPDDEPRTTEGADAARYSGQ